MTELRFLELMLVIVSILLGICFGIPIGYWLNS
jgi:ABC-type proline/glycine betaine transport system permease subunit